MVRIVAGPVEASFDDGYEVRRHAVQCWLTTAAYEEAKVCGITRGMTMPNFAQLCTQDLRAFEWLQTRAHRPGIAYSVPTSRERTSLVVGGGTRTNPGGELERARIEWIRSETANNNMLLRQAQIEERQASNACERKRIEAERAWCKEMLDVLHSPADMSVLDDWWND